MHEKFDTLEEFEEFDAFEEFDKFEYKSVIKLICF